MGLGGRRFFMTMGAGLMNTLLFAAKRLSENGYITLTGMTVGAYLAANTIQQMTSERKDEKPSK